MIESVTFPVKYEINVSLLKFIYVTSVKIPVPNQWRYVKKYI
jgi:hypothetical protein